MRNILAFLAAAVIVLGGVGWYLDWFKFSTVPSGNGHQSITIDVDVKKAGGDAVKGAHELKDIIEKDKSSTAKADGKGDAVNADGKKVEVQTKNMDVSVPLPDFQFPQR